MKKILLVIFALALLLIAPVNAWSELWTGTIVSNGQGGSGLALTFHNASKLPEITRIYWEGTYFIDDPGIRNSHCPATQSYGLYDGATLVGNGTLTMTCTAPYWSNYSMPATLDYTITDIKSTLTGTKVISWGSGYTADNYFCGNYNGCNAKKKTDFGWVDPFDNDYAVTLSTVEHPANGVYTVYSGSAIVTPVAAFTCTPTSQFPGAEYSIECTDLSTNNPTDWYWTIDWDNTGIDNYMTTTTQNASWSFPYSGIYSVNLRANNSAGYDWENKSAYLSISENATPNSCSIPPLPGYIRSMAQCVDSQTNGAISGCDLSLLDKEGGAWSNVTDRFDGTWCIDTYPGHHIDAYGWADGYTPSPTYRLNLPASSSVMYELLMHPGYVPPAAAGKIWLYVLVNDADTKAPLSDAHVVVSASGETTKSDYTDVSGSMHIQWKNATSTYVAVDKSGYTSASKYAVTSDFGPDTVRVELHKSTVTPTATATTGPGGTVPTTASPWQNPDGSYKEGYSQHQGQEIMNLLATYGYDLVLICIFVTICALLGFKFGGK